MPLKHQQVVAGVALPQGVSRAILYQALVSAHPEKTKKACAKLAGYSNTTSTWEIEQTVAGIAGKLDDEALRDFLARHPLYSKVGVLSRLAGIAIATDTTYELDDKGRKHKHVEYREPAPVRIQAEKEIIKVAGHEAPKQYAAKIEAKVSALFLDLADLNPEQLEALCGT